MGIKRKIKRLNRKWRRFWQIVSLAGFVLCLISGIYTLSLYSSNAALNSAEPETVAISNSSSVASGYSDSEPAFSREKTFTLASQEKRQQKSSNCGSPSGGPTDNPIADRYGSNAYAWTNQIRWNCVYNIKDFQGSTMVEQFNAARDAAAIAGGGTVYFPAGIYKFGDSIYLKNGVVLRGDTPSVADAKSNGYAPPSKLVFPKYEPRRSQSGTSNNTAFKKIFTASPNEDSNLGLVNLDINRAAISIVGDPDTGIRKNLVIFGIRSNNVAEPDPKVPDLSFQEAWLRYSYRFATNIKVNARENILIANNRLNDATTDSYQQPGYRVKSVDGKSILTYKEGWKVPFSYTDHYGIAVNRSKPGGFQLAATPATEPGLFRKGITIRDNWVYHTMRVGIHASGDGLIIQDNQIKDKSGKQAWAHPTGLKEPRGAATFENRAIDWSGWNVRIEGNQYQAYRHQIMDSNYLSTDGEGILAQECCGGTIVKGARIIGNEGNSYIGLYKVRDLNDLAIAENRLLSNVTNTSLIFVVADTNAASYSIYNSRIENNTVNGSIELKATAGGSGNVIKNNRGNNSGSIIASSHVRVSDNIGFKNK